MSHKAIQSVIVCLALATAPTALNASAETVDTAVSHGVKPTTPGIL